MADSTATIASDEAKKTKLAADTKRRVKLYVLNEQRSWDDKGTGHVIASSCDAGGGIALTVRSELDSNVILESKILLDTAYQKQQETLIVWSEAENCDLALSFQEKVGCDEIWEKICQVQGKDPSVEVTQDMTYEGESDDNEGDTSGSAQPAGAPAIQLPPPEMSKLSEVLEFTNTCMHSQMKRETVALAMENERYIPKLLDVFRMAEDLEDSEKLGVMHKILKNIFHFNKNALFEILFSDDHIKDVVGVLEYDPSPLKQSDGAGLRTKHRDFLWEKAEFREVIPISTPELKAKIHQTYRVQYIQDVMLPAPSIFEENMLSSLNSFIFFNKVEIVSLIQDDENFLQDLFSQLSSKTTPPNRRRDLTMFLKEFCGFSQTLQPQARDGFFKTLSNYGILCAIERSLSSSDDGTRVAAAEIFAMVVDYSPLMVREHMLNQVIKNPELADDQLLMNIVIRQLFSDEDPELSSAMQLLNILRILVDPENMMTTANAKSEKTEFLSFFYKRCMSHLCRLLIQCTDKGVDFTKKDDYHTAHKLSLILEVVSFCIEHHTYNIRNYMMNKELLRRVLVLLQSKHTFLALGALRLFRRVVQLKDDFYVRHIVRQDLFDAIVKCWKDNGHRYNLKNSALLELFEYIRAEDIKQLTAYFVENYYDDFKDVDYVRTFHQLKLRYDQAQDRINAKIPGSPMVGAEGPPTPPLLKRRHGPRDTDPQEDDWFNEDEEEWDDELPTNPSNPSVSVRTDSLPLSSSGGPKTPPPVSASAILEEGGSPPSPEMKSMPPLQRGSNIQRSDDFPSMMKHRNVQEPDTVFSPGNTRPQFFSRTASGGPAHKISISIKSHPLGSSNFNKSSSQDSAQTSQSSSPGNLQPASSNLASSSASPSSPLAGLQQVAVTAAQKASPFSPMLENTVEGQLGKFGRISSGETPPSRKRSRPEEPFEEENGQESKGKRVAKRDREGNEAAVLVGPRLGALVDYDYGDSDSEEDEEPSPDGTSSHHKSPPKSKPDSQSAIGVRKSPTGSPVFSQSEASSSTKTTERGVADSSTEANQESAGKIEAKHEEVEQSSTSSIVSEEPESTEDLMEKEASTTVEGEESCVSSSSEVQNKDELLVNKEKTGEESLEGEEEDEEKMSPEKKRLRLEERRND